MERQIAQVTPLLGDNATDMINMSQIAAHSFSQRRFPEALKDLMQERRLSYRQLAYKTRLSAGYLNHLTKGTRPVPSDPVIQIIAAALRVDPGYFLEYRLRQVAGVLDDTPPLADTLYNILVEGMPVPDDLQALFDMSLEEREMYLAPQRAAI